MSVKGSLVRLLDPTEPSSNVGSDLGRTLTPKKCLARPVQNPKIGDHFLETTVVPQDSFGKKLGSKMVCVEGGMVIPLEMKKSMLKELQLCFGEPASPSQIWHGLQRMHGWYQEKNSCPRG